MPSTDMHAAPRRALADFAGRWSVERRIVHRGVGIEHVFEGSAALAPGEGGFVWHETGRLVGGGATMNAERRYLWREAGGLIEVRFEDGRPFHAFDPSKGACDVHHDCPPDLYAGRYELTGFPDWSLRWTVRGPRKDYVSTSIHRRLAPSAPVRDTLPNHAKERT